MNRDRIIWLPTLIAALLLTGCGQQEAAAPAGKAIASDPPATPIDQATAGEVTGKVVFAGTKPELKRILMAKDPVCEERHTEPLFTEDGEVNGNDTLPNVFVYVKEGAEKYTFAVPTQAVSLDQRGCLFQPHVLGIMARQELRVVSSDPTTHNVHAVAKENREWNESQPPGATPIIKRFARPEIMIPVKCNRHPWMRAYVGVTRNPFYAVTGYDGTFTLKGLPAGDYTLEAWTATFGTQQQKVTVRPKESTTVDFAFKTP